MEWISLLNISIIKSFGNLVFDDLMDKVFILFWNSFSKSFKKSRFELLFLINNLIFSICLNFFQLSKTSCLTELKFIGWD